ncbi:ATP-dependent endonuclease [Flavipsychrobacter stenotrophus]|uniref:ATP-dependent endonuclease n=2 Tax=Flavipsychrobacter stenotrophus TaxID=2077091 RepID=A0A2S7SQB7_9BACT|nr:ATP-dependent endonuclease [Flavipsychrobacter stenotrophus]
MYISNIKLWNFRKFGTDAEMTADSIPNLDLNLNMGLNVIIGENDSGKTAIIDAIKLVLKTHSYDYIKVEEKDFHNDTSRFRIELTFKGLLADEAKDFTEWLGWEGTGEAAKPVLKIIYDVRRQGKKILPSDVKAGIDNDGYQLTAEAKEYLKATYLKPLRDAENELIAKRNSRLSQILLGDSAFKGKEKDHELVKIFEGLSGNLKKYFNGEFEITTMVEEGEPQVSRPQGGKIIKDKIDGYIKIFYGQDCETEFEVASNDIKSILEKLTLSLQNEPNPGLGTLNRLFMAAELLHLNKSNWTGIRLGLIEEIEAHLHPQAQMQVIESFQKQKTIQLILTTHSPNLASKLNLENLIICNNGKAYPMGANYTKLVADDYKFLEKFLDVTKANLFFAKGILLVEGWAEEILISSVAKNIGINLTEKGVSIVNVGNLAFNKYANIFLRRQLPDMTVPIAVLTDSDIREYQLTQNEDGNKVYLKRDAADIVAETQQRITDLKAKSEKNVQYFIAPNWTLEYSLFKSISLTATFQAVARSIHTGTDWNTDFEKALAEKLINKGLSKTEIAYQIANSIDEDLTSVDKGERVNKEIVINPNNEDDSINYLVKAIRYAAGN